MIRIPYAVQCDVMAPNAISIHASQAFFPAMSASLHRVAVLWVCRIAILGEIQCAVVSYIRNCSL